MLVYLLCVCCSGAAHFLFTPHQALQLVPKRPIVTFHHKYWLAAESKNRTRFVGYLDYLRLQYPTYLQNSVYHQILAKIKVYEASAEEANRKEETLCLYVDMRTEDTYRLLIANLLNLRENLVI